MKIKVRIKRLSRFVLAGLMTISVNVMADSIDDFNNSWAGKALGLQRTLDNQSPIIDNNILGTHNTYNSEVYRSCNFSVGCRYADPQQKHSIKDQLRMGARFIEIDIHWTLKQLSIFNYRYRLLMCHGICSIHDKYSTEGFSEIASWLNDSRNAGEVIILYVEDHSGGAGDLYGEINNYFGNKVYTSGGCKNIPDSLTKAQVLAAGKQVVFWKDGGCSGNSNMANMAYTGLGNVGRIWEDSTTHGTINEFFNGGIESISSADVKTAFATGGNIVNLDDMVTTDGRLAAGIWSWNTNEPNNSNNEDCAMQYSNGRWNDAQCGNYMNFACRKPGTHDWFVTVAPGPYSEGNATCANEAPDYKFDAPTNSQDNEKLKAAKATKGISNAWVNANDLASEGNWQIPGNNHQVSGSWSNSGGRSATSSNNPRYSLNLTEAVSVEINLTSAVDTYLYLLDANGNQITYNDDGGTGYNSRLVQSLSAGSYTLVAATYSSGQGGSFQLTVDKGDLQ